MTFGPFRLDVSQQRLWRGEEPIALRPKALAVLAHLAARAGRIVDKTELLRAVWRNTHVSDTVLKVCVREIRTALGDTAAEPRFIETVASKGYRWIAAAGEAAPPVTSAGFTVVGREQEIRELRLCFERARRGDRQTVFVTGEPGIGKTTVVDAFVQSLESGDGAPPWIARGQSIEHFGSGEPYLPLLAALGDLCLRPDASPLIDVLKRRAPTWLLQLPQCGRSLDTAAFERQTIGATRERMLRELAEALEIFTSPDPEASSGRTGEAPSLILVLEDLHWSDAATLDFLAFQARRRPSARLLVIGTYRPVEVVLHQHPLGTVKRELLIHGLCRELALPLLGEPAVTRYVAARSGWSPHDRRRPGRTEVRRESASGRLAQLARALYRATEGNPLFIANIVDYSVAAGGIVEVDGTWQLRSSIEEILRAVPEGLRELIEKQVNRLPVEDQRILGAASVAGDEFLAQPLAEAIGEPTAVVEERLAHLARRRIFLRAEEAAPSAEATTMTRYAFLHALYPRVLRERLPSAARRRFHLAIAQSEERLLGPRAHESAARLAGHFAEGGDRGKTVRYLTAAGELALRRFANHEAIAYFRRALDWLEGESATADRDEQELAILVRLGVPLLATGGFGTPEVVDVYSRAGELCRTVGHRPELFPILRGLYTYHLTRAEFDRAYEIAEQLERMGGSDRDLVVEVRFARGYALLYRGDVEAGTTELERGVESYDASIHGHHNLVYGLDPAVGSGAQAAWGLWLLGRVDRALARAREALALAHAAGSPFDVALALHFLAATHLFRGESADAERIASQAIAVSAENDFYYWRHGATMCRGGALALRERFGEAITLLERGIAGWDAVGMRAGETCWLSLLADALRHGGDREKARSVLARAFALVEEQGERWWEPELHRLQGELSPQPAEGAACFRRALDLARARGAVSHELRAATSLARLGRHDPKGREILADAFARFEEGIGTADWKAAHALLREEG